MRAKVGWCGIQGPWSPPQLVQRDTRKLNNWRQPGQALARRRGCHDESWEGVGGRAQAGRPLMPFSLPPSSLETTGGADKLGAHGSAFPEAGPCLAHLE